MTEYDTNPKYEINVLLIEISINIKILYLVKIRHKRVYIVYYSHRMLENVWCKKRIIVSREMRSN